MPSPDDGVAAIDFAGARLWPTVCLRSAGLPFDALRILEAPELLRALDAGGTAEDQVRELTSYWGQIPDKVSGAPWCDTLMAALAWQNPGFIAESVRPLLAGRYRAGSSDQRGKAAKLVAYLERYAAKNDTVGFFGPVAWGTIGDGSLPLEYSAGPTLIAQSRVFLEDWAEYLLRGALGDRAAQRPALSPVARLDQVRLILPFGSQIPVSPAEADLLSRCDGTRTRFQLAEAPDLSDRLETCGLTVDGVLDVFEGKGLICDAAALDLTADEVLGKGPADQGPAGQGWDDLMAEVDDLSRIARQGEMLIPALDHLHTTFTQITGKAAGRTTDTARTVARVESRRNVTFTLGRGILDDLGAPLEVLFHISRWLVTETVRSIEETLAATLAALGADEGAPVNLADLWLKHAGLWFSHHPAGLRSLTDDLQSRWRTSMGEYATFIDPVTALPEVRAAFPVSPRPTLAVEAYACPDLMIGFAGGDITSEPVYVLGEMHLGRNTLGTRLFSECSDVGDSLDRLWAADGGQQVALGVSFEAAGRRMRSRFTAHAQRSVAVSATSPEIARGGLRLADFDVVRALGGPVARHRSQQLEYPLPVLLSDAIAVSLTNAFRLFPPIAHRPRLCLGPLVLGRESWTPSEVDLERLRRAKGAQRLREVQGLADTLGLPRFLFARTSGRLKPFLVDTRSPASVDVLIRQLRRSASPCTFSEMLPEPSQLWLTDAIGQHYTSEFRMVANLFPRAGS